MIKFLGSNELYQYVDFYHYKKKVFIMLEFMEQGNLTNMILESEQRYSENFCRYSLYKVALGLRDMHEHNVLHRDIKSDNILHSLENGEVKISDLGLSCALSQEKRLRVTEKGTKNWMAPEIFNHIQYAKSVDIWSYGCFAYELAMGVPPFSDK